MKRPFVHAHVTFQIFNLSNFPTPNVQTQETLELEAVKLSNSSCFKLSNSNGRQQLCTRGIFKLERAANFKLSNSASFRRSNSQRRGRPNLYAWPRTSNSKLSNCQTLKLSNSVVAKTFERGGSQTLELSITKLHRPKLSKFDVFKVGIAKNMEIEFEGGNRS